jgi:hypothetical protein
LPESFTLEFKSLGKSERNKEFVAEAKANIADLIFGFTLNNDRAFDLCAKGDESDERMLLGVHRAVVV